MLYTSMMYYSYDDVFNQGFIQLLVIFIHFFLNAQLFFSYLL